MRSSLLAALLLMHSGLAQAQMTPSKPAAPAQSSLQERFNAATEAWERGDCATALPLFTQLAGDPRLKPGSLPASAVAMRRGDCLISTGKADEGEVLVAAALPGLRKAGPGFKGDVATGESQLGVLAMERWDHDTALAHFDAALALEQGAARLMTLSRIADLTAFDGGRRGLDAAEEGIRLLEADGSAADPKSGAVSKASLSQWHVLHARILLNQGDIKAGRAELRKALALSGGEKGQVNLVEALLRADLAQAAMLDHDKDDAYKFMALSGAGRIEKSVFSRAVVMEPPVCGPDTGLEPQDDAVVEFSIGDDGRVESAQTIYATGNYAKAAAFARAMTTWAWLPEDAVKIPGFFRAASRVELRCTNAEKGTGRTSPMTPLKARFGSWAREVLSPYAVVDESVPTWGKMVAVANAAQDKGDVAGELAARTILASIDLRASGDARASIERALVLVNSLAPATPGIGARLTMVRSSALVWLAASSLDLLERSKGFHPALASLRDERDMLALAQDPRVAVDPLAQDTALLEAAARHPKGGDDKVQEALIQVAGDARLGDHHPLRQFAQLRMANDVARKGDLTRAQQLFQATGLNEEQCALIGPRPALTSSGANSSDFPTDALRWGFEGWVRTEFDIKADGHTAGVRAVVAYPPFVFATAAEKILSGARYQSSFRPEGGAACSANSEMVNFKIPNNPATVSLIKKKS